MAKKRFIFDENYIKRYAKKDKAKWLVIGASGLVLIFIVIIVILASRGGKGNKPSGNLMPVFEFKKELVLEAGSLVPDVADYFTKLENVSMEDVKVEYPTDFEIGYDMSGCSDKDKDKIADLDDDKEIQKYSCVKPILKNPATYGVTISLQGEEYTVFLKVQDTEAPILITKGVEKFVGEDYDVKDFVQMCSDVTSDCDISYYDKDLDTNGNKIDYGAFKEKGEYTVKIVAKDDYQNESKPVEATLIIKRVELPIYSVTFNTDGGSAVDSLTVEEGDLITAPSDPIKSGYIFNGWYNGDDKFDFRTPIESDITLVAKWEKVQTETPQPPTPKPPIYNPGGTVYVNSIYLDYKTINLYVGGSKTVNASVSPSNAVNRAVTWSSSDNSIATVNNGVITGHKAGTVSVTATAGGKSASVTVVVRENSSSVAPDKCPFGDTNYNKSYTITVDLTKNGCAVDPNQRYSETISSTDFTSVLQKLISMGYDTSSKYFDYNVSTHSVRNNAGTGIVGYQLTITISIADKDNPYQVQRAKYILNSNGSRNFISNTIQKNNVSFK